MRLNGPSQLLAGKTVLVTGASRGIGRAIAVRCGAEGANVVLVARTDQPDPKVPGTIHTVAAQVQAAFASYVQGVLPLIGDVRDDKEMTEVVEQAVDRFGGIDILVNAAAVIYQTPARRTRMLEYDYMADINSRGVVLMSTLCLPALTVSAQAGRNPHILNFSPPINMNPDRIAASLGYAISKYAASLATIGMAADLRDYGIAVNSLWPRTSIDTALVRNVGGGPEMAATARTTDICTDAAMMILTSPELTGQCLLDEPVLAAHGVTDFDRYSVTPGTELSLHLFVDA
ncbi:MULTISPECIES: SDR family oxidoreductase [unclassified Nocardia]|uniref:SDR family oxidoreductase n=1 Tax=unclassified Nocardia TaxID=2637762 RepID=UPI001CE3EF3D|nr:MULTISPECIES: SDR family oxidoreductase [unclassified Nocardia]